VALSDDLARIAAAAEAHLASGETVAAIVAAEVSPGERTYLCAFTDDSRRTWLALDEDGTPVFARDRVREVVSITALCEVADETAWDGGEAEPRVASLAYLDEISARASRDRDVPSAIRAAMGAVDELAREVESEYKLRLT